MSKYTPIPKKRTTIENLAKLVDEVPTTPTTGIMDLIWPTPINMDYSTQKGLLGLHRRCGAPNPFHQTKKEQ